MNILNNSKKISLIGFITFIFIIILSIEKIGGITFIYEFGNSIFTPFRLTARNLGQKYNQIADTIINIGSVLDSNLNLKNDLINITTKYSQVKEQLEKLQSLNIQSTVNKLDQFTLAKVIDFSNLNFPQTITIKTDIPLEIGDIAIIENYAVGEIIQVKGNIAKINTIFSKSMQIPVVDSELHSKGIVSYNLEKGLIMSGILPEEKIEKGDLIVTTGIKSSYPSGLVLGKVVNVSISANNYNKEAQIEPLMKILDFEYLYIVKNNNK